MTWREAAAVHVRLGGICQLLADHAETSRDAVASQLLSFVTGVRLESKEICKQIRRSCTNLQAMWHLLHSPPGSGAVNMALDEALMSHARETGHWVFRVYSWVAPTLSLGRNQTARGGYDLARLLERGIDVVRRPTGGRAILHDREVTYSVVGPIVDAGDLRESCSPDCGSSAPAWRWWPAIRRIHPGRVIWNEHSRVSSPAFTIRLVAKSPSTDESLLEAPSGDATARYFSMARSSSTTIKCNCPHF